MRMGILWLLLAISLLIWILGLALSWGGWIWIFFVVALIAGGVNIIGLTGKRSGVKVRYGKRR